MKTSALILAAGQSRRFNGIKQLAMVNNIPLIRHTLQQYTSGSKLIEELNDITVVLGSNAQKIKLEVPKFSKLCIVNDWQLGMGHSLACGVGQLTSDTTHLLVGLADQVAVNTEMLTRLLHKTKQNPNKIVTAHYSGHIGVPTVFPEKYFCMLANLTGDKGARYIIQNNKHDVIIVDMPQAAVDIDTQVDLVNYTKQN